MSQINDPVLWKHLLPVPTADGHKYDRGCVVVFGGAKMTGAARLASMASMRIGAGVCIVVAAKEAAVIYRETLPAHIIVEDFEDVESHLKDPRRTAVVIGPGMDEGHLRDMVLAVLKTGKPIWVPRFITIKSLILLRMRNQKQVFAGAQGRQRRVLTRWNNPS